MTAEFFTTETGSIGPWRNLQECARFAHEQARSAVQKQIDERKKMGVPLDNEGDWRADIDAYLKSAKGAQAQDEAREHLAKAVARVQRGLHAIPPYEEDPELVGIQVKFRALSQAAVLEQRAAVAAAAASVDAADHSPQANAARWLAVAAQHSASKPFVMRALAGVRGIDGISAWEAKGDEQCPEALVDMLDNLRLFSHVLTAALDFMSLGPKARGTFGVLPQSTSPSSSAGNVPHQSAQSSDVIVMGLQSTSREQSTRPDAVHGVTTSAPVMSVSLPSGSTVSVTAPPEFPL
jgi:hypothetical protein